MKQEEYRFAVYRHTLVIENGLLISRNFIVLKDGGNRIIAWTDFHRYIRSARPARNAADDGGMRFFNACSFLNYLFFGPEPIDRLTELTPEHIAGFLNYYGMGKDLAEDEPLRTEKTVNACIQNIISFSEELARQNSEMFSFTAKDLYTEKRVYNSHKKKFETRRMPNMEILFISEPKAIFRDIPDKAFRIIFRVIKERHTDILMLAALGAFEGMRPSECCNVRRADSALGAGIRFSLRNGKVEEVIIDLSHEIPLRSDLIKTGGIKKERIQKVYPAFIEPFCDCYRAYMKHIEGRPYEPEYGALTVNRDGKAMTYQSYYQKFREAVKDAVPLLLSSSDPETVNYGHLLMENSISPHIFRHWFSVRLTLYGEDISGLMYWRGDRSIESSLTYLQNKGDLEKQYKKANSEIFSYQLWKAGISND